MNDYMKLLEKVPTPLLLKAARERKAKLKNEHGNYGALMVLRACPGCAKEFGARALWRHKRICKKYQKLKKAA